MIGIVIAMEKEAKYILDEFQAEKIGTIASKDIYTLSQNDKKMMLIISGIGKVNAGMSTQILIDKYDCDVIINIGFAGGSRKSNLSTKDVVLITRACQYDFDLSEIDNVKVGYIQDYDRVFFDTSYENYTGKAFKLAKCASADRFTSKEMFLQAIDDLGAEVVDMECGAIAEVCTANNVKLFALKIISDVAGKDENIFAQYKESTKNIDRLFSDSIIELINNIQ